MSTELHRRRCNVGNWWVKIWMTTNLSDFHLISIIASWRILCVEPLKRKYSKDIERFSTVCRSFEDEHNNVWRGGGSWTLPNVQPHEPLLQVWHVFFSHRFRSWIKFNQLNMTRLNFLNNDFPSVPMQSIRSTRRKSKFFCQIYFQSVWTLPDGSIMSYVFTSVVELSSIFCPRHADQQCD